MENKILLDTLRIKATKMPLGHENWNELKQTKSRKPLFSFFILRFGFLWFFHYFGFLNANMKMQA